MDDFSGVNEGASPSSGESFSPMPADSGRVQDATPAPGPDAGQLAQSATQESGGDAPATEPDPFDEQVAQVPEHQRAKFTSLLEHKKSLEKDLKALRAQWQPLADQYGDAAAVAEKLAQFQGLGTYATNDVGQYITDPQTGVPQLTTQPWLAEMAQTSPGLLDQLMIDLWSHQSANGKTYGEQVFWEAFRQMGLDPARVDEYAAMPKSQVANAGQPTADELQFIDPSQHETYARLTKAEREYVQAMVNDVKDDDVRDFLRAAEKRHQNEQRLEAFDNYQRQQEQAETQSFWQGVQSATEQSLAQANSRALASLNQQIASQVQFSSDPETNTVQQNMVSALVVALVSPETRFAMQPIMDALGISLDPQLDQLRTNATQAQQMYETYAALEKSEKFKQHRNSMAMNEASREAARLQQQVLAKIAPIALKIAKTIAHGNQGIREASQQDLAKITSRPAIGNGAAPTRQAGNGKVHYPRGKEFDFSYQPT